MFGYVRPPLQELPEEEVERFRRMYCGLCHTLGKQYGTVARFILNYDFTYLTILLTGQEEPVAQRRCLRHPVHPHSYFEENEAMELAADESVILAYWQLRDNVDDHQWLEGLKDRSLSAVLEPAYRKAAARRPHFDRVVRRQLDALRVLERENCGSIDRAADTFAVLLGSASEEIQDPVRRRVLHQILYHLGRWIYLVDAADDLKEDLADGNYNPVALRFSLRDGVWTPESRSEFATTLDHSVHMMATAFELWDFGSWQPLLEKTFYTGLFQVGKAVLDGTFRGGAGGEKKKHKSGEETT